jgi:hypothetical protein
MKRVVFCICFAFGDCQCNNVPYTLATMIGTARPRVNFSMNKFRMRGFIKYGGRLDANGGMLINSSLLARALGK